MEAEVAELEHQLRHRLRPGLGQRRPVARQAQAEGHQDVVEGGGGAARGAAQRDVGGLLVEIARQRTGLRAIECQQDHGKCGPSPLGLQLEPVLQLLGHPIRFERSRAHQHRQPRRRFDRGLDRTPERITPLELARIDPHRLPQVRQCLPQLPHEAVVGAAVGEEQMRARHWRMPSNREDDALEGGAIGDQGVVDH